MTLNLQVHTVAKVQPDTPVGETALLTLGALLRNSRSCGESGVGGELEHNLNSQLQVALHMGNTEQVCVCVYVHMCVCVLFVCVCM